MSANRAKTFVTIDPSSNPKPPPTESPDHTRRPVWVALAAFLRVSKFKNRHDYG